MSANREQQPPVMASARAPVSFPDCGVNHRIRPKSDYREEARHDHDPIRPSTISSSYALRELVGLFQISGLASVAADGLHQALAVLERAFVRRILASCAEAAIPIVRAS